MEKSVQSLIGTVSSLVESPRFSFLPDVQQIIVFELKVLELQMKLVAEKVLQTDTNQMRYKLFQVHHFACWFADLKLPKQEALICGEVKAAIRRKLKCLQTVLGEVEDMLKKKVISRANGNVNGAMIMSADETEERITASTGKHVTFLTDKRKCGQWTKKRLFWLLVFTVFWLSQLYVAWPYLSETVPQQWASIKNWFDSLSVK